MKNLTNQKIQDLIIEINGNKYLLDRDVAKIYGTSTKRINEAVKNNKERFPQGYIIELSKEQKNEVVEIFDHLSSLKYSSVNPKAFSEKGLYMLATILTSKKAVETTINIIETFAKIKELSSNIAKISNASDKKEQANIIKKSGEIIAEILDDDLQTSESETTIELNFAMLKFKHTIKKNKK